MKDKPLILELIDGETAEAQFQLLVDLALNDGIETADVAAREILGRMPVIDHFKQGGIEYETRLAGTFPPNPIKMSRSMQSVDNLARVIQTILTGSNEILGIAFYPEKGHIGINVPKSTLQKEIC